MSESASSSQQHQPPAVAGLADARRVGVVSLAFLGSLVFVVTRFNNAWLYFLPPVIGPLLGGLFVLWRPLLPLAGLGPESRLPWLLRSGKAKYLILVMAMATAGSLSLLILIAAALYGRGSSWVFPVTHVAAVTFLCALWSITLQYHVLFRWALRSQYPR